MGVAFFCPGFRFSIVSSSRFALPPSFCNFQTTSERRKKRVGLGQVGLGWVWLGCVGPVVQVNRKRPTWWGYPMINDREGSTDDKSGGFHTISCPMVSTHRRYCRWTMTASTSRCFDYCLAGCCPPLSAPPPTGQSLWPHVCKYV